MTIYIRSRVRNNDGEWYTEWMKKVRSWKAAWAIVDGCVTSREECRKWKSGDRWMLDIGGEDAGADPEVIYDIA